MDKVTAEQNDCTLWYWLWAITYISFIYATLEYVRIPTGFLRSHNLLRASITLTSIASFAWILFVLYRRQASPWQYVVFIFAFSLYPIVAQFVKLPEEQIHFFEYGLVGVLFLKALHASASSPPRAYVLAFTISFFVGWFDEFLQGLIPSRRYDVHDVFLNAISIALGLLIFRTVPPVHTQKEK